MAQERRTYTREFKQEAVRLAKESSKSTSQIARDLGIDPKRLYQWKRELQVNGAQAFPGSGHLTDQEEELRRLRRELAVVEQERDILKKALAIFSKEQR